MKIKLLTIALAIITAFSLTASNLPEMSAKNLATCKVTANTAEFFVSATEKTMTLKKGTSLQIIMFGGQGVVVVKAKVGKKWIKGEIQGELTSCQ
jgi:hypothetical protein